MNARGAAAVDYTAAERARAVRRGLQLEYLTVGWNALEAVLAIATGALAGSIALVGFGFESVIEVGSGGVLLWLLLADRQDHARQRREAMALKLVGISFFVLAAYIAGEAAHLLIDRHAPESSYLGMAIAVASMIVMPLLARGKRRVASGIGSPALRADSRQTSICAYLSVILLGGLALNAWLGWWWSDPVAALVMLPLVAKEGIEALRAGA
ncbi:MAG TPA: cation transporter [Candidatus Acidoferrales bacterium]|nr:cation transporter [Candidatus Acidoferrales bacterium]